MRITRITAITALSVLLLAGCAPAAETGATSTPTTAPATSAPAEDSSSTETELVPSAGFITNLDEAVAFTESMSAETDSLKFEVFSTAGKFLEMMDDATLTDPAAVTAQLDEIRTAIQAASTTEEMVVQLDALKQVAAQFAG